MEQSKSMKKTENLPIVGIKIQPRISYEPHITNETSQVV